MQHSVPFCSAAAIGVELRAARTLQMLSEMTLTFNGTEFLGSSCSADLCFSARLCADVKMLEVADI